MYLVMRPHDTLVLRLSVASLLHFLAHDHCAVVGRASAVSLLNEAKPLLEPHGALIHFGKARLKLLVVLFELFVEMSGLLYLLLGILQAILVLLKAPLVLLLARLVRLDGLHVLALRHLVLEAALIVPKSQSFAEHGNGALGSDAAQGGRIGHDLAHVVVVIT